MLQPEDKLIMSGFVQGTIYMQSLCGQLIPYVDVLTNWVSVWAEHQAVQTARKAWN